MKSFSGKPFPQHETEITTLRRLMVSMDCQSYLEIGARYGDSFHFLASALPKASRAVAVDMPGGPWGKGESLPFLRKAEASLNRSAIRASLILGDSRDPQVIVETAQRGPFDAVFIDGDHSPEGVRADWENYGPLGVKIVVFHDIVADQRAGKRGGKFGVGALWRELKEEHSYVEIAGKDSPMGIGVILL